MSAAWDGPARFGEADLRSLGDHVNESVRLWIVTASRLGTAYLDGGRLSQGSGVLGEVSALPGNAAEVLTSVQGEPPG